MSVKELMLLLFVAICVVLIGSTVVEALTETRTSVGGIGGVGAGYSVSLGEPTPAHGLAVPTPTLGLRMPTPEGGYEPSFVPGQHDEVGPPPTVTPAAVSAGEATPGK